MATTKTLKVKTGVCKRMMKELQSYQAEADKDFVKVENMKNSYADPFDIKQQLCNLQRRGILKMTLGVQEHVLAESCLMITNCRKRLETALASLEAAVAEAEAETTAEESEELSTATELVAQVKPLFAA
ncbi:hypothetical protein M758_7G107100 [Ceratodon purpureus]|uniref:Tubulin-specific chaperone A n=1 Tax=Ceratodon purpureus TaxID=3225 RepID=A0A8T0HC53_CERPU|nr:hypothetical protein KC19_7G169200 [Ceratodon purpureus]KAG0610999.1 hypothetical protein M758_7G107100 [Ceratodon purpureus]